MNLKITSKTPAPLLLRSVVEAELDFDKATPSNEEVKKSLAKAASADANLVVVKKIDTKYGVRKANVTAYVYDNADSLKKIEPKSKKKEKPAEKKEAAEKPAEKKEEKPAEKKEATEKPAEKKEEKPAEKKEAAEKKGK